MTNRKKKPIRAIIKGITIVLAIALVTVLAAGQISRKKLASRFPPPGTMVTMPAGHQLHVYCEGEGPLTILLEAGLNDFSLHWYRLQPQLATITKTCAYDRAGLGWSEASSRSATIDNAVEDLHQVVRFTANDQPVILVGHSYGSLIVRHYADKYPEHIQAVVLLDPANEYQDQKIAGYKELLASAAGEFKTLGILSSLGIMALSPQTIPANDLEGIALERYRAVLASGNFFTGAAAETGAMIDNLQIMQKANLPMRIPVTIFSRGLPYPMPGLPDNSAENLEQTWAALQTDLVNRLKARQIFAAHSGHYIQVQQPELVYEFLSNN